MISRNEPYEIAVGMFAVDVFGIGRAVTVLKAENAIRIRANSLNVVRIGDESFMLVGVVVDNRTSFSKVSIWSNGIIVLLAVDELCS